MFKSQCWCGRYLNSIFGLKCPVHGFRYKERDKELAQTLERKTAAEAATKVDFTNTEETKEPENG
jgi:hypothetical protein